MRDVDIKPTVAVDVGSIDAHPGFITPVFAGRNTGEQRNIFKGTVVLVDEEKIGPRVVCNRDVGPTVIIEIGQHHAHSLRFGLAHAGGIAYVAEGTVAVVVV